MKIQQDRKNHGRHDRRRLCNQDPYPVEKTGSECTLSDLGIKEEDIPWMTENCMKVSAAGVMNNPVVFSKEEIAEIYRKAL